MDNRLNFYRWLDSLANIVGGCFIWIAIIAMAVIYGTILGWYLLGWLR